MGREYVGHSVGPIQLKVSDIGGRSTLYFDRFCIFDNRLFSIDISGTNDPRKVVHLSKFAEFYGINSCNTLFIDRVALVKQGDNRIGSVRPSVCAGTPIS